MSQQHSPPVFWLEPVWGGFLRIHPKSPSRNLSESILLSQEQDLRVKAFPKKGSFSVGTSRGDLVLQRLPRGHCSSLRHHGVYLLNPSWRLVAQSWLTLRDPVDCSPPGSSVHGIHQARTLEWAAMPSSRGFSQPRDRTQVSSIAGRFCTISATRKAHGSQ